MAFDGIPIRSNGAAMLSMKAADWGNVRAAILRREHASFLDQRFKLPWHSFRLSISGEYGRGSTTKLDGLAPQAFAPIPNQITFYPSETNIENKITSASRTDYLIVEIDPHELSEVKQSRFAPILSFQDQVALAVLKRFQHEVERPTGLQRLFFESAAQMLLAAAATSAPEAKSFVANGLSSRHLSQVKQFMMEYAAEDVSLAQLTALVGLSRAHFLRKFKISTGTTPHQWLLSARIEKARSLLRDTDLSLAAVASAAGFVDRAHFTKTFRKFAGQPPGLWRRGSVG